MAKPTRCKNAAEQYAMERKRFERRMQNRKCKKVIANKIREDVEHGQLKIFDLI